MTFGTTGCQSSCYFVVYASLSTKVMLLLHSLLLCTHQVEHHTLSSLIVANKNKQVGWVWKRRVYLLLSPPPPPLLRNGIPIRQPWREGDSFVDRPLFVRFVHNSSLFLMNQEPTSATTISRTNKYELYGSTRTREGIGNSKGY